MRSEVFGDLTLMFLIIYDGATQLMTSCRVRRNLIVKPLTYSWITFICMSLVPNTLLETKNSQAQNLKLSITAKELDLLI